MTELEQIAASVANALGLERVEYEHQEPPTNWEWRDSGTYLDPDGSNLFWDHWRCACLDWLLERGRFHHWDNEIASYEKWGTGGEITPLIQVRCPPTEFPARAIHALMARGKP